MLTAVEKSTCSGFKTGLYTENKAGAIIFGVGAILANGSYIMSWEPLLPNSTCGIILAPKLVPFLKVPASSFLALPRDPF